MGMKWPYFDSLSIITRMQSVPLERGKPVMKSRAISHRYFMEWAAAIGDQQEIECHTQHVEKSNKQPQIELSFSSSLTNKKRQLSAYKCNRHPNGLQ